MDFMKAIPDQRTGRNTSYPITLIAMIALSAFYAKSNSLSRFVNQIGEFRKDRGVELMLKAAFSGRKLNRVPTDNHIRSVLDRLDPTLLDPIIWDVLSGYLCAKGEGFKLNGQTLIVPYISRHFESAKSRCPKCVSRKYNLQRLEPFLVEHYHTLMGFSAVHREFPLIHPQLPLEFLQPEDHHGYSKGEIYLCSKGEKGPPPALPEVLTRYLERFEKSLASLKPIFILRGSMGTFRSLGALGSSHNFVLIPNTETLFSMRAKIPHPYFNPRSGEAESLLDTPKIDIATAHDHLLASGGPLDVGPDLYANGLMGFNRQAYLMKVTGGQGGEHLILTSLKLEESHNAQLYSFIDKLETVDFPEHMQELGFSFNRRFGHGKNFLREVLASMNILAMNLSYMAEL
jgi:hypothetical protein